MAEQINKILTGKILDFFSLFEGNAETFEDSFYASRLIDVSASIFSLVNHHLDELGSRAYSAQTCSSLLEILSHRQEAFLSSFITGYPDPDVSEEKYSGVLMEYLKTLSLMTLLNISLSRTVSGKVSAANEFFWFLSRNSLTNNRQSINDTPYQWFSVFHIISGSAFSQIPGSLRDDAWRLVLRNKARIRTGADRASVLRRDSNDSVVFFVELSSSLAAQKEVSPAPGKSRTRFYIGLDDFRDFINLEPSSVTSAINSSIFSNTIKDSHIKKTVPVSVIPFNFNETYSWLCNPHNQIVRPDEHSMQTAYLASNGIGIRFENQMPDSFRINSLILAKPQGSVGYSLYAVKSVSSDHFFAETVTSKPVAVKMQTDSGDDGQGTGFSGVRFVSPSGDESTFWLLMQVADVYPGKTFLMDSHDGAAKYGRIKVRRILRIYSDYQLIETSVF